VEAFVPDFVTFGKGSRRLPLSAVVGPARILDHPLGLTVTTTPATRSRPPSAERC